MLTGDIKSQIDRIWDAFWSGGISNPLEVADSGGAGPGGGATGQAPRSLNSTPSPKPSSSASSATPPRIRGDGRSDALGTFVK